MAIVLTNSIDRVNLFMLDLIIVYLFALITRDVPRG